MFEGKRIIVTGATSGIGMAVATELLEAGAHVIAVGRRIQALDGLRERYPAQLEPLAFDLTQFAEYSTRLAGIKAIDGLVYSAGVVENNPLRFFSMEKYQRIVDINQTAPIAMVAELARTGAFNSLASIVFLSSILGTKIGMKGTAAYAGTKAALTAYAKVMALEFAHKGIRVNCVSPGMVETELVANQTEVSEAALQEDRQRYPLGKRYARTPEVSGVVCFLLSDRASFVTGENFIVDGGFSAQ